MTTISPKIIKLEDVKPDDIYSCFVGNEYRLVRFQMTKEPGWQRGYVGVTVGVGLMWAQVIDVITGRHRDVIVELDHEGKDYYAMCRYRPTVTRVLDGDIKQRIDARTAKVERLQIELEQTQREIELYKQLTTMTAERIES